MEYAAILDVNSANLNFAKEVALLEPFGAGNSKPKFLIKDATIIKADLIGADGKHVRAILSNKSLAGFQKSLPAIAFGAMENALGEILISKNKGKPLNIIGQININNWMGNQSVQLMVEDIIL